MLKRILAGESRMAARTLAVAVAAGLGGGSLFRSAGATRTSPLLWVSLGAAAGLCVYALGIIPRIRRILPHDDLRPPRPDVYHVLPETTAIRIGEDQLISCLSGPGPTLLEPDPASVGAFAVESIAALHPQHAAAVRRAGIGLLEAFGGRLPEFRLTLPIALQALERDRGASPENVEAELARRCRTDGLLALAIDALLPPHSQTPDWIAERGAVMLTAYLLLRMVADQEEADRLEEDFGASFAAEGVHTEG